MSDAIAYLRSCPEGNDPLEFIFGDLVEDFSDAETHVLMRVDLLHSAGKSGTYHRIAEWFQAAADLALRSLINRSLVVPSEELQTFTLVPLVADFLRKKKPEVVA